VSRTLGDVFADTVCWVALVSKADQYHETARMWSQRIEGAIITTHAVLEETCKTLSRPAWRSSAIGLLEGLFKRDDIRIVESVSVLWNRGLLLYRNRPDKSWGLTDCISSVVMDDLRLQNALLADVHFRQAGFRAILIESAV